MSSSSVFASATAESMDAARMPARSEGSAGSSSSLGERYDAAVAAIAAEERVIAAAEARRARWLTEAASLADQMATADGAAATLAGQEMARRRLAGEIGCATRRSEGTVTRLVNEAEHLVESLPATLDALGRGSISYLHARYLVSHAV